MLSSSTQFRFLSRTASMHINFNTRARWWMYIPKWSLTPSRRRLAVASSPDSLLVLWGHQGGSGSQRLPQDQDSEEPIQRPRRTLEQRPRTRPASKTRAAPPQSRTRRGSGWSPRWSCSGCSPVGGEEPAAAPEVAGSAPSPARRAGGRGGMKTKGWCRLNYYAWTWVGVTPGSN